MKPAPKNKGFTLLELLLVLAITGTVLALVSPNLPGALESAKFRSAQRELISALRYARNKAAGSGDPVDFILDTKERRINIRNSENDDHQRRLSLPESATLTLITAKSERRSETAGAILFYADGSSSGGRITLRHGDKQSRIDIDWLTGKIGLTD